MAILEFFGFGLVVLASVLILRAWWQSDQPEPTAPRMRVVRPERTEVLHKRAA